MRSPRPRVAQETTRLVDQLAPLPYQEPVVVNILGKNFIDESHPYLDPESTLCDWPWAKRAYLSHIQGNKGSGLGYATNYTTLEILFAPQWYAGQLCPMLDFRGHRFDDDTFAINVGFMGRYIPPKSSLFEVLGFNIYYDWRQGYIGQFNQIGVGFEILNAYWDLRVNGYVPFGPKNRQKIYKYDAYTDGYFAINSRNEAVSYAFNAEAGWLAYDSDTFLLYVAGGPYYLAQKFSQKAVLGGEIRIQPQIRDYFALNLKYNYDGWFKSVFQAEIIVSFPLYQLCPKNMAPASLTARQIYQRVERFEVMPLARRSCWSTNW
jgi:hypothetical protein